MTKLSDLSPKEIQLLLTQVSKDISGSTTQSSPHTIPYPPEPIKIPKTKLFETPLSTLEGYSLDIEFDAFREEEW